MYLYLKEIRTYPWKLLVGFGGAYEGSRAGRDRCGYDQPWFWVLGLGFGVWGSGFGVWGLGFRVWVFEFAVEG